MDADAQTGMDNPLEGKLLPVGDDDESEDVVDPPEPDQLPIDESDTPGDDPDEEAEA
jgi:hypothetical protein